MLINKLILLFKAYTRMFTDINVQEHIIFSILSITAASYSLSKTLSFREVSLRPPSAQSVLIGSLIVNTNNS